MAGSAKGVPKRAVLELPADGMDLEATLFCGQSFSWERSPQGGFTGVAAGRAAHVWQRGDALCLTRPGGGAPTEGEGRFWRRYFALEEDWPGLLQCLGGDEALAECLACAPGLRVLRQPFWDVLLSFVISQNNNIKRITGIVGRLCRLLGPQLYPGIYGFPAPEALAGQTAQALAPLGAGYRAGYLIEAARAVAEGRVTEEKLQPLPDGEARALLCGVKGIGTKVADCVLLYGLGRDGVVPMDVWMKRAMVAQFPAGLPPCAAGREGIAQQYIFHWARQNL